MAERMGVAGEFDAEDFNRGLNRYINALLNAERATDQFVQKLNALGASTNALTAAGPALQLVAKAIAQLNRSLTALGSITLNTYLPQYVNQLAAAGARLNTVAPGMAVAARALGIFARSISSLGGVQLNAQPLAQFIEELFRVMARFGRFKTITNTVTNLRSMTRSLQQLSGLSLNAGNITQFVNQFAPAMLQLSRALRNMAGLQKVPAPALASLSALANVLRGLGGIQNVTPALSALSRVVKLIPQLAKIPPIPPSVAGSLGIIGNALTRFASVANLNPTISGLRRLAPILQTMAKLRPIPSSVLNTLQRLSTIIKGMDTGTNLVGLGANLRSLTSAVRQLQKAQQDALPGMQRFSSAFTQGLGVGVGFGAVQMIQKLASGIANLGREALRSITFFEGFTVALESVVAIGMVNEGITNNFAQALEMAQRPARGLRMALEELAVFSPFTTQEIAQAFRTATAYGFTAEQALNLSKILVDFTSGAGLTGDELYRISLALSQVQARGKLAGEEVRQLANAGVPVVNILAKGLNKTSGEMLNMIRDGKVLANSAIPLILDHMKQWEGAGKRLATTFSGLLSSLRDIQQIAFRDLFGGAFAPLQPVLQELIDFLTSPEFRAGLLVIGEMMGGVVAQGVEMARTAIGNFIGTIRALDPETRQFIITAGMVGAALLALIAIFGVVSAAVIALVNPFTLLIATVAGVTAAWVTNFGRIQSVTANVVGAVGRMFSALAQAAVKWGANIANSLARGITMAVQVVTKALSVIGRAISGLLRPGSPPKLLPHLTEWGAGAASAYMDGWTQADFSALDAFAGMVQGHLQSLVALGDVSEVQVPGLVIQFRKLFSQAIDQIRQFGQASNDLVQQLAGASRIGADAISAYLSRYAALQTATTAVTEAQNALNATIKHYTDLLKPLNNRLKEIQEQQADMADEKQMARLRRILNNKGISDSKRLQTQLELEELTLQGQIRDLEAQKDIATETGQTKLDAAKEAQEAAQNELDLITERIKSELQYTALLGEEARIRQQLAEEAARAAEKELTALEKALKTIEFQQQALQDMIDAAEARYIINSKDYTLAQKKVAALRLQEIELRKQARLVEAQELGFTVDYTEVENIPIVLEDFLNEKKIKGEDLIDMGDVIPNLQGGLGELDAALTDFETTVATTREQINGFFAEFQLALDNLNANLPSFLQWKTTTGEVGQGIQTLKNTLIVFAAIVGGARVAGIIRTIPVIIGGLLSPVNAVLLAIGALALAWSQNWFNIRGHVRTAVTYIDTKIGEWVGSKNWSDLKTLLGGVADLIKKIFTGELIPEDAVALIGEKVRLINEKLKEIGKGLIFKDTGVTLDEMLIPPEEDGVDIGLPSLLSKFFGDIIAEVKTFWEEHIGDEGLVGWIGNIIEEWIRLMGESIGNFVRWMIGTGLPRALGAFKWLVWDGPIQLGKTLNTFDTWLQGRFRATGVAIQKGFELAWTDFKAFITTGLWSALGDAGKSVAEGFILGFKDFIKNVGLEQMLPELNMILDYILAFWGIESPSTVMHDEGGVPMGEGLINGFIKALIDNTERMLLQLGTLKTDILTKLDELDVALVGEEGFYPTLNTSILGFWDELAKGTLERVDKMITDLMPKFTGPEGLLQRLQTDFVEKGYDLGESFIQGMVDGIDDMVGTLEKAAEDAVQAANDAAAGQMEAKSPAKVPERELGRPFAQGFAQGILREVSTVIAASQRLTDAALSSMHTRLGTQNQATVAPVTNNSSRVYNLNVNSTQPTRGIVRDFRVMEVMAGA